MKKFVFILLALSLIVSMAACGMRNNNEPTTTVITAPTVITLPTMDTNIPDPTVNSNSTDDGLMDTTEGTRETSDPTHTTDDTDPEPKIRRRLFH